MNQPGNNTTRFLPILICALFAGAAAVLLHFIIVPLHMAPVYNIALPVLISVPLALLGAYGYEKGMKNLGRGDVIKSVAGGVGAAVGVALIVFFS